MLRQRLLQHLLLRQRLLQHRQLMLLLLLWCLVPACRLDGCPQKLVLLMVLLQGGVLLRAGSTRSSQQLLILAVVPRMPRPGHQRAGKENCCA